jgi:anaerobic magnesium-protoporphyrin IX monomethyl ester cyclase
LSPHGTAPRPVRAVLIYVGAPESEQQPVMSPPIGTQLLGSLLLEAGASVELLDTRLHTTDEILGRVDDLGAQLVAFSYLSPAAPDAERLAARLRAPGRTLVAGGVHVSIHTAETVAAGVFDCVVRREGERAILDIHAALAAGTSPPALIEGTAWPDLDTLPDYADFDCYAGVYAPSARYRSVYLQLGRGCPMSCTFCELPNREVFEPPRRRFRSIDKVMAEVHRYAERWGVNFVTIADPIATLNTPLIDEFVRRMDEELPQIGFMFNAHVNRFARPLAERLGAAQSGRDADRRISVWFGFESGSQRLLNFMRKGTSVERGVAAARLCHEFDIQLGANLLLGVPTETAADYVDHHAFMAAARPTFPNPNILNPLPGTEMYDYCLARGLLRDPADHSIWRDEDIAARAHGPVLGVDYARVLAAYDRYRQDPVDWDAPMATVGPDGELATVEPVPVDAPRYRSWAGTEL